MALPLKRAMNQTMLEIPASKRPCLRRRKLLVNRPVDSSMDYVGSSDRGEFNDSDDKASEIARKSLVVLTLPEQDNDISKAVSQYSDDEDIDRRLSLASLHSSRRHSPQLYHDTSTPDITRSHSFSLGSRLQTSQNLQSPLYQPRISDSASFSSLSTKGSNVWRDALPKSDFAARSRCLDYLVGAIDEAWARYCSSTSRDEEAAYGYCDSLGRMSIQPQAAGKINESIDTNSAASVSEDGSYESDSTNPTDMSDYEVDTSMKKLGHKRSNQGKHLCVSEAPDNIRLQKLKDRLTESKYYLQDYVDSDSFDESILFWKKWDLVKYAAVDLVEDDDDGGDDIVENTIEDLEAGRLAVSYDS